MDLLLVDGRGIHTKNPSRSGDGFEFPRYHPCWLPNGSPLKFQQLIDWRLHKRTYGRLASLITLGLRPRLVVWSSIGYPHVHLSSSGGNFSQFPPGGGFSPGPSLPCRLLVDSGCHACQLWPTFLRHRFACRFSPIICEKNYLSSVGSCN